MISCHIHDYIEIACLYGYQIKLELNDGSYVQGKALTTLTTQDKRELLKLECTEVDLEQIRVMTALTDNPHFSSVQFPSVPKNT